MLLQLNISNFALIENLSITFDKGFNIFSGETGAGKSILVDAINYVLGSKFNKELIRTGETRTFVEAVFTIENKKTEDMLKSMDIEYEDMVIISRESFVSGKTIVKVNGKSILLSNLKNISSTILDIHGQHENQNLLDSSNHILYLDYFGGAGMEEMLMEYRDNYDALTSIEKKIEELSGKEGEREKLADFLKYQIEEIDAAKLKSGEEEELEKKYEVLSNAEKINMVLAGSYEALYNGSEEIPSIFDRLGSVIRDLRNVETHMDKIKEIVSSLEEAYYNIEENTEEIRNIKDNIYYDENELEYINGRIYAISGYKKKYGNSIDEILQYRDKISNQYEELVNSAEIVEKLKNDSEQIKGVLLEQGRKINLKRNELAEELEGKVHEELKYIGLEKSVFKISIEFEEKFNNNGCDKVHFLISTNPGEPMRSLEKVVSGGELSRIMLALKTVFVDKDRIPSIIFDEVDTGISGRVAQCVAEKMFAISCSHQVFCVTHLPQIACMSDVHYLVSKEVKENKTFTDVRRVILNEKEYEVARMIGGSEVTRLTLEHAKELIKMADDKKEDIRKKYV